MIRTFLGATRRRAYALIVVAFCMQLSVYAQSQTDDADSKSLCIPIRTGVLTNGIISYDNSVKTPWGDALSIRRDGKFDSIPVNASFSKQVVISEYDGDGCEITLKSKGYKAGEICLRVRGYDPREREVLDVRSTSRLVDNEWTATSVRIDLSDNPRMLSLDMYYRGDNASADQTLWLSDIGFRFDGEYIPSDLSLDARNIVDLNGRGLSKIIKTDLVNCRIVGLGESIKGSRSIQEARYDFCKALIRDGKCRFVVLDNNMNALLWDLYVQGLGEYADTYRGLERKPSAKLLDAEALHSFMDWIRDYNSTRKPSDRVHVTDLIGRVQGLELVHYFSTLLGENDGARYMVDAYDLKIEELLARIKTDSDLMKLLGETGRDLLVATLENTTSEYSYVIGTIGSRTRIVKWMEYLSSRFGEGHNIAILADGDEISYFAGAAHYRQFESTETSESTEYSGNRNRVAYEARTLGQELRESFGSGYFAIDFTAGKGTSLKLRKMIFAPAVESELETAPLISFENAALKTGKELFYCPSQAADRTYMLSCGSSLGDSQYKLRNVRGRFGAYVFVRESVAADITYKGTRGEFQDALPINGDVNYGQQHVENMIARLREMLK